FQNTSRGDLELIYRLAFRKVPQAQWKNLVQRISYSSGFGGEVSAVTASTPEDTAQPFHFAYDYTRKEYSDWKDRLITPPMPPFGIEARPENDKKPTEPVILGAPGEVVHRARVELPSGYAPKLPKNLDLTTDFADYHSTYSLKDGVLTAERRLVLKKYKIPLAEWDSYRNFGKSVADDEDTWIDLNGGKESATETNPEAERIFREGYDALQKRDLTTALEDFRKVLELDPKHPYAHGNVGIIYLMQKNPEGGFKELRQEEELHPESDFAYRAMALELMQLHRNDEAMEQWRQLLKVDPKNRDAVLGLGGMLIAAKKYQEAVSILENAVKLAPDSEALQHTLGYAYLKTGQSDKGIPVLEKIAQSDPKPKP
ncbi:MAG TPA: tetratricopeptide repeat protein, partial [Terriglobales bacterium]|nr:tetratricopeptide repeat protein [Terriglobales bacterium]